MIKKHKYLVILFVLVFNPTIFFDINPAVTMSLFVRKYPDGTSWPSREALLEKLNKPGKVTNKILQYYHTHPGGVSGVLATYMGSVATSTFDGEITFVRKHKASALNLLVTSSIEPVMMLSSIIHHWQLSPSAQAAMYQIERKQDAQSKFWYWNVTKVEIPKNKVISLDTIVVFAKPDVIEVPQGVTLTTESPQWVLPPLYTRKGFSPVTRSLEFLKLRHFFGPQKYITKPAADGVYFSEQLAQ